MISVEHLTQRYGRTLALDDLNFEVRAGVTGFLGPNGAGKTTAMRAMVGLETPTSGSALIDGCRYRELPRPLCSVGTMLDGNAFHPGRSARNHLAFLAASNGLPMRRVSEVLELTGLVEVAGRRVGRFSLGMKQRLGIAAALIGDPATLVLDEPTNGLDLDGILWLRDLLASFAAEGRTVLVSSHQVRELAVSIQHLLVIGRGRLLADLALADLVADDGPGLEDLYLELTRDTTTFTSGGRGQIR